MGLAGVTRFKVQRSDTHSHTPTHTFCSGCLTRLDEMETEHRGGGFREEGG